MDWVGSFWRSLSASSPEAALVAPVASFAALLLAAAALYGLRGVSPRQRVMGFPYARRAAFLSEGEARLWRALREAAPGLEVFPRAALRDVVTPRSGLSRAAQAAAGERLGTWTVDFALVDPVSMRALAVVAVRDVDGERARARDGDGVVAWVRGGSSGWRELWFMSPVVMRGASLVLKLPR